MRLTTILLLLIAFVFSSCSSPNKLIKEGKYERAFQLLLTKLNKNPKSKDTRETVLNLFSRMQSADLTGIQELKQGNDPDKWLKILKLYQTLEERQSQLSEIDENIFFHAQYKPQNYLSRIENARYETVEDWMGKAEDVLKEDNRNSFQQAYAYFKRVDSLWSNYNNVQDLIEIAEEEGTAHVFIDVRESDSLKIPSEVWHSLDHLDVTQINEAFIRFDTIKRANEEYDFEIELSIDSVMLSGEQLSSDTFQDTKQVNEGWEILKDLKGNVVKDATGSPISVPRYAKVKADVQIFTQKKSAVIRASIRLYDDKTDELLDKEEVRGRHSFMHQYARISGDSRAVSERVKSIMELDKVEYPTDTVLLLKAAQKLKKNIYNRIRKELNYMEK